MFSLRRRTLIGYATILRDGYKRTELKVILLRLLDLVEEKSSGIIKEINSESIEKLAGIQIDDLLSILSISQDAYTILQQGGDKKAIKSASIIQRVFKNAGSNDDVIEYCSRCKTNWDVWLRNNRHVIAELDYNSITQKVKFVLEKTINENPTIELCLLKKPIVQAVKELDEEGLLYDLNQDLILGGIISELVRGRT